ncbi:dehydrogenase, E1 component [Leptospira ryugenii]|uniref:Dehydrogenase, E1 component n=1 Tax=Leptospira ryugenii TaxID=1917863 RepID=A0A2P2DXQ7_9LEPT|nr:hypothetical protein [Leptospira ryugenii]GBF49414.1 dehydrogenase, E1 component [Leptospira ryugenii]
MEIPIQKIEDLRSKAEAEARKLYSGSEDQVLDDIDYFKRSIFILGVEFAITTLLK